MIEALDLYEQAVKSGKRLSFIYEEIIRLDPYCACLYARDVIKGRWIEAEKIIMEDPQAIYLYARDVIKDRWLEAEPIIMKCNVWKSLYERHVINKEKIKSVDELLQMNNRERALYLFDEAEAFERRLDPEYEDLILNSGVVEVMVWYARDIMNERWYDAEPYILKNLDFACLYTMDVIEGRWKELEEYILQMQNPEWAYQYAKRGIEDRWKEGEEIISKNLDVLIRYLRFLEEINKLPKIKLL